LILFTFSKNSLEIGLTWWNKVACYVYSAQVRPFNSYHQHYSAFGLDEHIRIAADYGIYLIGSYRLSVFAQVQLPAVDHVRNLLRTHASSGGCQTIDYGFFYLHATNLLNFHQFMK